MVDASDNAMGAALNQVSGNSYEPLPFFSKKKITPTQKKYSTYDRELLAAYTAIKYFRSFLEARTFILYTDHKPLIYALAQNPEKATPRQARYIDFIAQFTSDIRHISGKNNIIADAFSRVDMLTFPSIIPYEQISNAQMNDSELQEYLGGKESSMKLEKINSPFLNSSIICDTSTGKPRPYIPLEFRKVIFDNVHNFSHPGIKATN